MKKKIIALVLAVMTMCTTAAYAVSENVGTVTEDGNIQLNPNDDEIVYEETTDAGRIQYYLIVYTDRKEQAHAMAEAARGLGYAENHPVIQLAQSEWGLANDAFNYYQNLWNTTYENKQSEYPTATTVWLQLKSFGWPDAVCAGIMGNMMAECGGNTLNLQSTIISSNGLYYGLCQWQRGYPDVWYQDAIGQCNFLQSTIEYEMNTYGGNYRWGFGYNDFMEMTDAGKAAEAFLRCYERGSTATLNQRKANAEYVLEYFVG